MAVDRISLTFCLAVKVKQLFTDESTIDLWMEIRTVDYFQNKCVLFSILQYFSRLFVPVTGQAELFFFFRVCAHISIVFTSALTHIRCDKFWLIESFFQLALQLVRDKKLLFVLFGNKLIGGNSEMNCENWKISFIGALQLHRALVCVYVYTRYTVVHTRKQIGLRLIFLDEICVLPNGNNAYGNNIIMRTNAVGNGSFNR